MAAGPPDSMTTGDPSASYPVDVLARAPSPSVALYRAPLPSPCSAPLFVMHVAAKRSEVVGSEARDVSVDRQRTQKMPLNPLGVRDLLEHVALSIRRSSLVSSRIDARCDEALVFASGLGGVLWMDGVVGKLATPALDPAV